MLLKEFTSKDKNNIISSGDDFTIAYEIELELDEDFLKEPETARERVIDFIWESPFYGNPKEFARKMFGLRGDEGVSRFMTDLEVFEAFGVYRDKGLIGDLKNELIRQIGEEDAFEGYYTRPILTWLGEKTSFYRQLRLPFKSEDMPKRSVVSGIRQFITRTEDLEDALGHSGFASLIMDFYEKRIVSIYQNIKSAENLNDVRYYLELLFGEKDFIGFIAGELLDNLENFVEKVAEANMDILTDEDEGILDELSVIKEVFEKTFPNFMKKWGNKIKFEEDQSLKNGIEFSPLTFLDGIKEGFNFLDDFYAEFNKQDEFSQSERTGAHINIGTTEGDYWNHLKGILFLSEEFASEDEEYSESRLGSRFVQILKKPVLTAVIKTFREMQGEEKLKLKNVFKENKEEIEHIINLMVRDEADRIGRYVGLNLLPSIGGRFRDPSLERIEFRFPGWEIGLSAMKEKTLYYCFLVKTMRDKNFKKKEYEKKFYKLIAEIINEIQKKEKKPEEDARFRFFKKNFPAGTILRIGKTREGSKRDILKNKIRYGVVNYYNVNNEKVAIAEAVHFETGVKTWIGPMGISFDEFIENLKDKSYKKATKEEIEKLEDAMGRRFDEWRSM